MQFHTKELILQKYIVKCLFCNVTRDQITRTMLMLESKDLWWKWKEIPSRASASFHKVFDLSCVCDGRGLGWSFGWMVPGGRWDETSAPLHSRWPAIFVSSFLNLWTVWVIFFLVIDTCTYLTTMWNLINFFNIYECKKNNMLLTNKSIDVVKCFFSNGCLKLFWIM